MQGLIEKRLLSMVLRMPINKKLLGTAVQGENFWPAPAEISGQDDYKKILVEQIILCLNNMVREQIVLCLNNRVREMQLMRSKKDSSNTKNVAAKNSMPDITARQKINAKNDVKSDAGKATIKRVQYLPVSEASLRKFGRKFTAIKIMNSLVSRMEKYLTTQKDVISFSNCPVLLPANPSADFIFEDPKKIKVVLRNACYKHPGKAEQPKIDIKNLPFEFMSFGDLKKIVTVLEKEYKDLDYITLYDRGYFEVYDVSRKDVFWNFGEVASWCRSYDLLISRIPKGEQRIAFILDKGLEPVIYDVDAQMAYIVLDVLKEKNLLAIKDNKVVWYAKQIDELIKTLQELDLWEEPSLEDVRKKLNDDYADDLKKELLARDKVRFDLTEYNDMLLEDPNGGSWELWEAETKQEKTVQTECSFYARDPRMDIVDGGVVGIDFGTKSTVVVTQDDSDAIEPVRIGKGDVVKEPSVKDYENPTVMQFIDIDSFMKDYQKYPGRPLTRYADATASHTAYNAWNENKESRDYFSYFAELKQWAGDSERRVRIRDTKGKEINLPPYEELQEGDFDPIELYAYYIGLHINNQYSKRIYMEYLLSFPVTYALDVRNRILNSFRKGLRRSLPQTVLQDAQCMEKFRVEQGVGEPAAYAVCALQEFKLFPKENEKIAYAIFDFGGGTTDFDFGIWRKASGVKERRYHYVIEHFGDGGDKYLGGENLLELLAFNVFCKNKQLLRTKKITFVKPPECERFIGYEGLLSDSQEAYSNMRQLMEKLRGFWEGKVPEGKLQKAAGSGQGQAAGSEAQWFSDGKVKVDLFTASGKQESVDLTVDAAELQKILQARIEQGVDSFFDALLVNINKDEYYEVIKNCDKINIFLAGNSSKSKILQEVFKKKISDFTNKLKQGAKEKQSKISFDKAFMLHQPLGAESKDKENAAACLKRPTGKTGVAIGLVQCRPGSVIKVISEKKTQEEIKFRLFIGHSDENGYFEADLTRDSKYNEWKAYFDAGEDRFEFYYTTSTSAGRKRGLLVKDSKKSRQQLPKNAVNEDWLIYLRPVAPNKIQYVVAEDDEALKNGKFKFEPVIVELNY